MSHTVPKIASQPTIVTTSGSLPKGAPVAPAKKYELSSFDKSAYVQYVVQSTCFNFTLDHVKVRVIPITSEMTEAERDRASEQTMIAFGEHRKVTYLVPNATIAPEHLDFYNGLDSIGKGLFRQLNLQQRNDVINPINRLAIDATKESREDTIQKHEEKFYNSLTPEAQSLYRRLYSSVRGDIRSDYDMFKNNTDWTPSLVVFTHMAERQNVDKSFVNFFNKLDVVGKAHFQLLSDKERTKVIAQYEEQMKKDPKSRVEKGYDKAVEELTEIQKKVGELEIYGSNLNHPSSRAAGKKSWQEDSEVGVSRSTALIMQYSETTGFVRDSLLNSMRLLWRAMITNQSQLANVQPDAVGKTLKRFDLAFARGCEFLKEATPTSEANGATALALTPMVDVMDYEGGVWHSGFGHIYVLAANYGTERMQKGLEQLEQYTWKEMLQPTLKGYIGDRAPLVLEYLGPDGTHVRLTPMRGIRSIQETYVDDLREVFGYAGEELKDILFLFNQPDRILETIGKLVVRGHLATAAGLDVYKQVRAGKNEALVSTFKAHFNAEQELQKQKNAHNAALEKPINELSGVQTKLNESRDKLVADKSKLEKEKKKKIEAELAGKDEASDATWKKITTSPASAEKWTELYPPVQAAYDTWKNDDSRENFRAHQAALQTATQAWHAWAKDPKRVKTEEEIGLWSAHNAAEEAYNAAQKAATKKFDAEYDEQFKKVQSAIESVDADIAKNAAALKAVNEKNDNERIDHQVSLMFLPSNFQPTSTKIAIEGSGGYRELVAQNRLAKKALEVADNKNLSNFLNHFGTTLYSIQTPNGVRYALAIPTLMSLGFPHTMEGNGFANSFIGGTPSREDPMMKPAMIVLDPLLKMTIEQSIKVANGYIDQGLMAWAAHDFLRSKEVVAQVGPSANFKKWYAENYQPGAEACMDQFVLKDWIVSYKAKNGGKEPDKNQKIAQMEVMGAQGDYVAWLTAYKLSHEGKTPDYSEIVDQFVLKKWIENYKSHNSGKEPSVEQKIEQLKLEWINLINRYTSLEKASERHPVREITDAEKLNWMARTFDNWPDAAKVPKFEAWKKEFSELNKKRAPTFDEIVDQFLLKEWIVSLKDTVPNDAQKLAQLKKVVEGYSFTAEMWNNALWELDRNVKSNRRALIESEMALGDETIKSQVKRFSNLLAMVQDFRASVLPTIIPGIKELDGEVTKSHFHHRFTTHFLGGFVDVMVQTVSEIFTSFRAGVAVRPLSLVTQAISASNVGLTKMMKAFSPAYQWLNANCTFDKASQSWKVNAKTPPPLPVDFDHDITLTQKKDGLFAAVGKKKAKS